MPLTAGIRLGPYEIVAPIGAGGMGEVYRARDTRLHRDVAIKVLPDLFAADPARLARFEREAQVLASLNHPHIAQIHGLEESGPTRALVMELVEGPTLDDRLAEGPMPFDDARLIAVQLVDALDAAHERGIVHRDLKPANIKLTADGIVKVLDFGLAKAMTPDLKIGPAKAIDATSPTTAGPILPPLLRDGEARRSPGEGGRSGMLAAASTEAGIVLGTAAYMAPEQARGHPVDKRTDIWAFGVVLYEMLTGQRLFKGHTTSETLAAMLTTEPDWTRVPAQAHRLLRRCLEKDPKRRLRDIGEARFLLDDEPAGPSTGLGASAAWNRVAWIVAATITVALAIALVVLWPRPAARRLTRFDIDLGRAVLDGLTVAAISPDGTRLVFAVRGADGRPVLATRLLDQSKVTVLAGTESADQPFFSPDGQWIGFFADGKLKKASLQGGRPVTLCDASNPRGASWGEDGHIAAALINVAGLSRVPDSGGRPEPLTTLEGGEPTHRWPQLLPGSRAVLFTAHSTSLNSYENATIDVMSFETGKRKTVWRGGYFGRYLPTRGTRGHLVYVQGGTLFAVPFDPARLEIEGTPVALLDDVASDPSSAAGEFDVSRTGVLVYRSGTGTPAWSLAWLDTSGKTQPLLSKPAFYYSPRFSPDGQRLAIAVDEGKGSDIFLSDWQRGTTSRLTFTAETNSDPVWTPDGQHIIFRALSSGAWAIWWMRADGVGEARRLVENKGRVGDIQATALSPDGRRLIYGAEDPATRSDLWILPLDISDPDHPRPGQPEPFLRTPFNEDRPAISPDGRWVAYASSESGTNEIYVRSFVGAPSASGGKWQISTGGGVIPVWSRTGSQLFYESADHRIMVAEYSTRGDSFIAGAPRLWSPAYLVWSGFTNLEPAPDGKRFVVFPRLESDASDQPRHVTVLLNFFDEVQRRAPGRP